MPFNIQCAAQSKKKDIKHTQAKRKQNHLPSEAKGELGVGSVRATIELVEIAAIVLVSMTQDGVD